MARHTAVHYILTLPPEEKLSLETDQFNVHTVLECSRKFKYCIIKFKAVARAKLNIEQIPCIHDKMFCIRQKHYVYGNKPSSLPIN